MIKSSYNYEIIKKVESTKFLGVHYDSDMSFRSHIKMLTQRLSRMSALIYRVKNLMPDFVLKMLYNAHVTSILNYCNIIWSNTYVTHVDPLIKAQKRLIRLITNSDFLAHTEPLFKQLHILNIENLRKYHLAIYFYKNLESLLPILQGHHHYETRNRNRPRPIRHSKTIFERSFMYQSPIVWNELLDSGEPTLTNATSLSIFKKKLKLFLVQ